MHASGQEDAVFSAVETSVEDLGIWASSSVFECFMVARDGRFDGTGRISATPVESVSIVADETEYRLANTHTLPFFDQRKGGTVGRMRDTATVLVTPAEPFSLSAALVAAHLVQDLITLATHRAAGVNWLRLAVAGPASVLPNDRSGPPRYAHLLYSPAALGKHDAKAVEPHGVYSLATRSPSKRSCHAGAKRTIVSRLPSTSE